MTDILKVSDFQIADGVSRFEGGQYGADISFLLVDLEPGRGAKLHSHPYGEVFIVRRGRVRFTVDEASVNAVAGDIIVAPAATKHGFVSSGPERLEMVNIHAAGDIVTRWLAEED